MSIEELVKETMLTDKEIAGAVESVKLGTLVFNGMICPDVELGIAITQLRKAIPVVLAKVESICRVYKKGDHYAYDEPIRVIYEIDWLKLTQEE